MKKQGCVALMLVFLISFLSACISPILTGASLIYDRHHVYKKIDDFELSTRVQQALYHDRQFKQPGCVVDVAVFNGDILLTGHVPTPALRYLADSRLRNLSGYRKFFNQLAISSDPGQIAVDSWITMKIRARILADSDIDPKAFKIMTTDGIVYVMGDVRSQQAAQVLNIARETTGVLRVVTLLNYYKLTRGAGFNQTQYSGL